MPNSPAEPPARRSRRAFSWAVVAFILVAGAGVGGWLLLRPDSAHAPSVAQSSAPAVTTTTPPPTTPAAAISTVPTTMPRATTSIAVAPIKSPAKPRTLGTGQYADGPIGLPHYYVLLHKKADSTFTGTIADLYENGTSGNLRTFTGAVEQDGAITITYNDGTLDLISDIDGQSFEISGCLGYLSEAQTRPDCTFSLHPGIATLAPPTTAAPTTVVVGYRTFMNPRFGFSTLIPAAFIAGEPPEDGDGLEFTSSDRRASVTVYGQNNVLNDTVATLEDKMTKTLQEKGGSATYRNNSLTVAAVSGTYPSAIGSMVFYERSVVGAGSVDTILWTYPVADKPADDPWLYKSVGAYKPGDLTQGH